LTVESFLQRLDERTVALVFDEHPDPGHRVQRQPVPAHQMQAGDQREGMGGERLHGVAMWRTPRGMQGRMKCGQGLRKADDKNGHPVGWPFEKALLSTVCRNDRE